MEEDPEEARIYLHRQAYWAKPGPELQDFYCSQFSRPKPPDKLAGEAIKKLRGKTAAEQLKAAKKLCRLACGNWTAERGRWLSDPRNVGEILKRMDNCDEDILIELIHCLGMTGDRYGYKDVRVRDKMLQLFDSSSERVQMVVAGAMSQFGTAEIWKRVVSVIDYRPTKDARRTVANAIARNGAMIRSQKMVQQFCDLMLERMNQKMDRDTFEFMAGAVLALKKRGARFNPKSVPKAVQKAIRDLEQLDKYC